MLTYLPQRVRRSLAFRFRRIAENAEARIIDEELVNFGVRYAAEIKTFTSRRELHTLYNLAASLTSGATVVEIGSYLGASTCYLAAALQRIGGRLTCVDTWQNETMPEGPMDTFESFKKNTNPFQGLITTVRKSSADLLPHELPSKCNLAFLDGDHSYEGVRCDVKAVEGRFTDDGVLVFHDIVSFPGVRRIVGEVLATGRWAMSGRVENLGWLRRINGS